MYIIRFRSSQRANYPIRRRDVGGLWGYDRQDAKFVISWKLYFAVCLFKISTSELQRQLTHLEWLHEKDPSVRHWVMISFIHISQCFCAHDMQIIVNCPKYFFFSHSPSGFGQFKKHFTAFGLEVFKGLRLVSRIWNRNFGFQWKRVEFFCLGRNMFVLV